MALGMSIIAGYQKQPSASSAQPSIKVLGTPSIRKSMDRNLIEM
jgi:hypothetical protein